MTDNHMTTGTPLAALVLQTQILHALLRTGTLTKPMMVAMTDATILTVEEMPRDGEISSEAVAYARKRLLRVEKLVEGANLAEPT